MRLTERLIRSLIMWLCICVCVVSLSGCLSNCASLGERQEAVMGAGSAYYPCGVRTLDDSGEERVWRGPTYVLPLDTYRALMMSE